MVCFIGKERTEVSYTTTVHSGKRSQTVRRTAVEEPEFLHQESPISLPTDEKGKVKPGDHNIPFRFVLPQGLPPAFRGNHVGILYAGTAKIDVPLWFDVNDSLEFEVISSGPRAFQSPSISACSDSRGNPQNAGIAFTLEGANTLEVTLSVVGAISEIQR